MRRIVADAHLIKRSIGAINFPTPFYFRKGGRSQALTETIRLGAALAGFYPDVDCSAGVQGADGLELKAFRAIINRLAINPVLLVEYGKCDVTLVEVTNGCSFFGRQTHFTLPHIIPP